MVKVTLSTNEIFFKPSVGANFERDPATMQTDLEVTVTNTTSQFISFQMALAVKDQTVQNSSHWYQVSPNVCAKKPPGDRTQFLVTILRSPIQSYNTTIPLAIRIFSAELGELPCDQLVYLTVSQPDETLRVDFPFKQLSIQPGDVYDIPIVVSNLKPERRKVTVELENRAANPKWFKDEKITQETWISGGKSREVRFSFTPPLDPSTVLNETYHLDARARPTEYPENTGIKHPKGGAINIRAFGKLTFEVSEGHKVIPDDWPKDSKVEGAQRKTVSYSLLLKNLSNLPQTVRFKTETAQFPQAFPLTEAEEIILGTDDKIPLAFPVQARRPWFGWTRNYQMEVTPTLVALTSDQETLGIDIVPASQTLRLKVRPLIPFVLQLLAGVGGLLFWWWMWFFFPQPIHTDSVNKTKFSAGGNLVVSGSSDRTIQASQVNRSSWRWLPSTRRLRPQGNIKTESFGKAVRTLGVSPKFKQIAVGLESGNVEILDTATLKKEILRDSVENAGQAPRIFDLVFTNDSRHLFGGYGDGQIRHWTYQQGEWTLDSKDGGQLKLEDLAISALAVSSDDCWIAIAAQYNRLLMWAWNPENTVCQSNENYESYAVELNSLTGENIVPRVNKHSYLTSVSFSAKNPNILAVADNRGTITIVQMNKLNQCRKADQQTSVSKKVSGFELIEDCEEMFVSQRRAGTLGSAVREVALTDNGCYLASTGDDGAISLWRLSVEGDLSDSDETRIPVARFRRHLLNTVDVHLERQDEKTVLLWVVADTPNNQVRVYRKREKNHGCG